VIQPTQKVQADFPCNVHKKLSTLASAVRLGQGWLALGHSVLLEWDVWYATCTVTSSRFFTERGQVSSVDNVNRGASAGATDRRSAARPTLTGAGQVGVQHARRRLTRPPGPPPAPTLGVGPGALVTDAPMLDRLATPSVLEESPTLLILVQVEVAVRVDPDSMAPILYGQNIRTRCAISSYNPNQGK